MEDGRLEGIMGFMEVIGHREWLINISHDLICEVCKGKATKRQALIFILLDTKAELFHDALFVSHASCYLEAKTEAVRKLTKERHDDTLSQIEKDIVAETRRHNHPENLKEH